MNNFFRKICLVVGLLLVVPVVGQAAGGKSFQTTLVADMEVVDVSMQQTEPRVLEVVFAIQNGDRVQGDINVGLRVVDAKKQIADVLMSEKKLSLNPEEKKLQKIVYQVPDNISGKIQIWVLAVTSNSLPLGSAMAGEIDLGESDKQLISIGEENCHLEINSDGEKKNYSLAEGLVIKPEESLEIVCLVKNTTGRNLFLKPKFDLYYRSVLGKKVDGSQSDLKEELGAGEEKEVRWSVPKPVNLEPQAYEVKFDVETDDSEVLGGMVLIHYVIAGTSATVQNVTLDKSIFKQGEESKAHVFWSESADRIANNRLGDYSKLEKGEIKLVIVDGKNDKNCSEEYKKEISENQSKIIEIPVKLIADCSQPMVKAQILVAENSSQQKVLSDVVFGYEKIEYEKVDKLRGAKILDFIIYSILAVIVAGVVYLFIWKRRKKIDVKKLNIWIIFGLGLGALFFLSKAEAKTYYVETFYDGDHVGDFAYNFNLDKGIYDQGDMINMSVVVQDMNCVNHSARTEIETWLDDVYQTDLDYGYTNGSNQKRILTIGDTVIQPSQTTLDDYWRNTAFTASFNENNTDNPFHRVQTKLTLTMKYQPAGETDLVFGPYYSYTGNFDLPFRIKNGGTSEEPPAVNINEIVAYDNVTDNRNVVVNNPDFAVPEFRIDGVKECLNGKPKVELSWGQVANAKRYYLTRDELPVGPPKNIWENITALWYDSIPSTPYDYSNDWDLKIINVVTDFFRYPTQPGYTDNELSSCEATCVDNPQCRNDSDTDGFIDGANYRTRDLNNNSVVDINDPVYGAAVAVDVDNDLDNDGILNGQDWDKDGDGIFWTVNPVIRDPNGDEDGDSNPNYKDEDMDGDGVPNIYDLDNNSEGRPDLQESDQDDDNDGVPDWKDVDLDNDGTPNIDDLDSGGGRTDGDDDLDNNGTKNYLDYDIDADTFNNNRDFDDDEDGIPDDLDVDDDNDGLADADEIDYDFDLDNDTESNTWDLDLDGDGIDNVNDSDIDNDGWSNELDPDDNNDGVVDCAATYRAYAHIPIYTYDLDLASETDQTRTFDMNLLFWPVNEVFQKHYQFPHYSVPSVDKVTVPLYCDNNIFEDQSNLELSYVVDCSNYQTPKIKLNWTQLQNIEATYIYKDSFDGSSRQILTPLQVGDNELLDTGISSNGSYGYQVQVKLQNGQSVYSDYQTAQVRCAPTAPTAMTVTGGCPSCNSANGNVNISWTQPNPSSNQQTKVEWSLVNSDTVPEKISNTTGLLAQWNFNDALSGQNVTTAAVSDGSCGSVCDASVINMSTQATTGLDGAVTEGWSADAMYKNSIKLDGNDDYLQVGGGATVQTYNYGTTGMVSHTLGLRQYNLTNKEIVFGWETHKLTESGNPYLENSPNYPSDYDNDLSLEGYEVWHSGARMIRVHFEDFVTEDGVDVFDYIGADTDWYSLSGNLGNSFSRAVGGDVLRYAFHSDSSNVYKGWKIDYYQTSMAISSSRYPSQYNENQDQWEQIDQSGATELRVHFAEFQTEETNDYVEILDSNDNVIATYSGDLGNFYSDWVQGESLKIHFVSNDSINGNGFLIDKYEYGNSIISSNFPNNYYSNTDQWQEIEYPRATGIRLNFSDFTTEENSDLVQLYDRYDNLIVTYSGDLGAFTSEWVPGDLIKVHFVSDGANEFSGFRVNNYEIKQEMTSDNYPSDYPTYWENNSTNISSPNYPSNYNDNNDVWQEIVRNAYYDGSRISLHFATFALEDGADLVELYDVNDNFLASYTGNLGEFTTPVFDTTTIKIRFVSNDSNTDSGFLIDSFNSLSYHYNGGTNNNVVLKEKTSTITSDNYPNAYNFNTDQEWQITETDSETYRLHFSNFDLDDNDVLNIYDQDDNLLQSFSGNIGEFWTNEYSASSIKLRFITDDINNKTGFKLDRYRYYLPNVWVISEPGAANLGVHFSDFNVNDDPLCDEVQVLNASDEIMGTYRGNLSSFDVMVNGDIAKIRMLNACGGRSGWKIDSYSTLEVNGVFSSNYPYNYPNNSNLTQIITQVGANNISLHFAAFSTFDSNDVVQILDSGDNVLAEYSGNMVPFDTPFFTGDTVKVRFVTDGSDTSSGWLIDSYQYTTGGNVVLDDLERNDKLTVETMVKVTDWSNGSFPIFGRQDSWRFAIDQVDGLVFGTETDQTNCPFSPILNIWQQYAVVYDRSDSQLSFLVDGQTVCSGEATMDLSENSLYPIFIGKSSWGVTGYPDKYANGVFDYLRIYNRALEEDEIRDSYENNNNVYNWISEPVDIKSPNYPLTWPNASSVYNWTIQKAGASQIQIHFEDYTWNLQYGATYSASPGKLEIFNSSDTLVYTCGSGFCPNPITVSGDTVKIKLTSNHYTLTTPSDYSYVGNTDRVFDDSIARRFKIDYYRWTQDTNTWQTIDTTNNNSVVWTPSKSTLDGQTIYFRAKTCDGQNCAPNYTYASQSFICGKPDSLELAPNPISLMNYGSSAPVTTYVKCGNEYYLNTSGSRYIIPGSSLLNSSLGSVNYDGQLLACRNSLVTTNSDNRLIITDNSGYFFGTHSEEVDLSSPNYPGGGYNVGDLVSYTITKPGATRMRVYFDYYILWPENVMVGGVANSTHDGFAPFYSNIVNGSTITISFTATEARSGPGNSFGFHINKVEWDDANSNESMAPCTGKMTARINDFQGYGQLNGEADVSVLNEELNMTGSWDCSEYDYFYKPNAGKVTLSWNAVEGAAGYLLKMPTDNMNSYYYSYVGNQLSEVIDNLSSSEDPYGSDKTYQVWAVDDQWRPLALSNVVNVGGECQNNLINPEVATDCSDENNPKLEIVVPSSSDGNNVRSINIGKFQGVETNWESDMTEIVSQNYPSNFPLNYDESWIYSKAGAKELRIHFSEIDLGSGEAYLKLFDGNNNELVNYQRQYILNNWRTLAASNVYSVIVPGDTVRIVFHMPSVGSVGKGFRIDNIENKNETGLGYMGYNRTLFEKIDTDVHNNQTYTFRPVSYTKVGDYSGSWDWPLYAVSTEFSPVTVNVNCLNKPNTPSNLVANDVCPACGVRELNSNLSWDVVSGASRYKAELFYRYKHYVDYDLVSPNYPDYPTEMTAGQEINWEVNHPGAVAMELDLTGVTYIDEDYIIFTDKDGFTVDSINNNSSKITKMVEGDTVRITAKYGPSTLPYRTWLSKFKIDGYYYYDYNPVGGEPAWIEVASPTTNSATAEIDVYKANSHPITYRVYSIDSNGSYSAPATLTKTFNCSVPQAITYNPASITLNNNGDSLTYQSLARCSLGETIAIDESLNTLNESLTSALSTCSTGTRISNKSIISGSNASNCSGNLNGNTTKPFSYSRYRWPYPLSGQAPVTIMGSFAPTSNNGASTLNDAIDSPQVAAVTRHALRYDIRQDQVITNGSLKVAFSPEFNLTGLTARDVQITGGDVTWGGPVVDIFDRTIVVAFTGSLDSTDEKVDIVLGETNLIGNPADLGAYPVYLTTHTSTDGSGENVDYASDTISIIDASLNDVLSNSITDDYGKHTIHYNILGETNIVDGSLKVALDPEFDMSGVTAEDVIVNGGGVTWGTPTMNTSQNMVILPFTGDLGATEGLVTIVVGNNNLVRNPSVAGSYLVLLFGYNSNDGSGDPVMLHQTMVAVEGGVVVTATIPSSLTMTILGLEADQSVNGVMTNVSTANDWINFGVLTPNVVKIAAQELRVQQNAANGFVVTMQAIGQFASGNNSIISSFSGSDSTPIAWQSPTSMGHWGYTTSDNSLSGNNPARFETNKWAGLATSPMEVMYDGGPTLGNEEARGVARVGYQVEITDRQPAGNYSDQLIYICTPSY